jgi:hypothetical protein
VDDELDNMETCRGCYKYLADGEGVFVKDYNETFCDAKCMVIWANRYDMALRQEHWDAGRAQIAREEAAARAAEEDSDEEDSDEEDSDEEHPVAEAPCAEEVVAEVPVAEAPGAEEAAEDDYSNWLESCRICGELMEDEYENTRIGSVCSKRCYYHALDSIEDWQREMEEERGYGGRRYGRRR